MNITPAQIHEPFPTNTPLPNNGVTSWRSPSNIALIKYWGKTGIQIPANPSVSFTLKNAFTETSLSYDKKASDQEYSVELLFEGVQNETFLSKVLTFFERVEPYFSFLKAYHFRIETSNSFPHSSGIASSASGMSALALCLCSIEKKLAGNNTDYPFFQKASHIARLGSGSACRSVYGKLAMWGKHTLFPESNDEWAVPYPSRVDPVFDTFQDTILLVDKGQKQVSSSLGHSLMNSNPFSEQRFQVANDNISKLNEFMQKGNIDEFGKLVEKEALMLHALMMTSDPYFLLFKPNTLHIIEKVWDFRNQHGSKVYITLDAGANVHLLYPEFEKNTVKSFIDNELVGYCENKQYICDMVGNGPEEII